MLTSRYSAFWVKPQSMKGGTWNYILDSVPSNQTKMRIAKGINNQISYGACTVSLPWPMRHKNLHVLWVTFIKGQ